jgi:hypothetical protein
MMESTPPEEWLEELEALLARFEELAPNGFLGNWDSL